MILNIFLLGLVLRLNLSRFYFLLNWLSFWWRSLGFSYLRGWLTRWLNGSRFGFSCYFLDQNVAINIFSDKFRLFDFFSCCLGFFLDHRIFLRSSWFFLNFTNFCQGLKNRIYDLLETIDNCWLKT